MVRGGIREAQRSENKMKKKKKKLKSQNIRHQVNGIFNDLVRMTIVPLERFDNSIEQFAMRFHIYPCHLKYQIKCVIRS